MNINKTIKSFKEKGYMISFFEKVEDATSYLKKQINNTTVGFGDSATLLSIDLYKILSSNNEVIDPQNLLDNCNFLDTAKKCLTTNIYITSANAFSETGELVNIDGTGNRVASSLFGHEKVYFVISTNKLVPTLQDAIWRARNVAAPLNAKRLGLKTPCAKEGNHCFNCSSPDRICNALVIYLDKMDDINMEIVLINEPLGY